VNPSPITNYKAPSDFPEFAEFLVECGIDSMSLNPDVVLSTRLHVVEVEKARKSKAGRRCL
jgi:pyruvate,water dikinase